MQPDTDQKKEYVHYGTAMTKILTAPGVKLRREGWNKAGMHVEAQYPDEGSVNTIPYFVMFSPTGKTNVDGPIMNRGPWSPSQPDMFADDWFEVV